METPTSTGTVTQPAPLKPWKQVAEESNIFSLPPEQRIAEYDKWSAENVAQGIKDGDFDSRDTFDQFKLFDIRTRKNLASDDIIGPSDDEVIADYNAFKGAFASTQTAFSANKPTPEDEAIQGEVLQGKRKSAFLRGQMFFNPAVVNDPQKYREAILESDAPSDIKMFYAGLRPEMEKSATVTRRRELANNVITRDVADRAVTAIQEGTELFGMDIGTPQSPALKKNKDGIWSVVDPEYVDQSSSMLDIANARYNPLGDSQYKPLAAINEYQKKYGLTDEQVQQDYMESLIENAPTSVNRWFGKATSIEDYVKQLDSTVRVKNKDVAPEVRVQDPNLFFDPEGYNAAVDKAKAPDEAKTFAKEARTQFADAVAGDIYNNLLNNRDDFREEYAKDVVDRKDMEKAITRYYKDKKDQAWYDDVGETIGQAGTALKQGGMDLMMMPSAIKGMFGDVEAAENYRYYTLAQKGEMQAEEAVANRTGGAGFIKLNNDVMRIIPDLVVQMVIAVATGGMLSGAQASLIAARTGISRAAATTALRQAAITGEKTALKSQLLRLIPEVTAKTVDDVAEEVLKASARTVSNNPFKGGIGTQRAVGSAYAGLSSASATFGQVYTDVRNMGKSPEESIATARTAGIVAGAITSGLTHSFGMLGRGGVEDFASMGRKAGEFTIKDIVNAGMLDSLKTPEGRQLIRNIAKGISKDALSEGAEEGLDQALNLISQYATNPSPEAQNRKATDIINESLYASLLGGIAGSGAASVGQARASAPGITAQQIQAEILGAQQPPVAGVPPVQPQQPPVQAPPVVPVAPVVPSANPAVQNAQAVANAAAAIPNTSQTTAALTALANAAAFPMPEKNLPEIETPKPAPEPEVQPAEEPVAVQPEPATPEVAPANAEKTPIEPTPTPAKVEPEPTENMKTEEKPLTDDAAEAMRDIIQMKKSKGEKPNDAMVSKLAEYDAKKSGVTVEQGDIVSNIVVGHPMFEPPHPELENLIPIKIRNKGDASGSVDRALKVKEKALKYIGGYQYNQSKAKTPAQKKQFAKDFNQQELNRQEEILGYLNNDVFPELKRIEEAAPEAKPEVARDTTKTEQMTPEKGDEVFVKGGDERITRRIDNIFTAEGKQMVLLQGLRDPMPLDEVTVDPKSDYRKRKQKKAEQKPQAVDASPQLIRQLGDFAVRDRQPINQEYINASGGAVPSGYVKQGELYVYQPEQKVETVVEVSDTQVIPEKTLMEISAYPDFSDRVTGGNMLDATDVSRYLTFRESTTSIPKADVAKAKKDLKNPTVSEIEAALSKYAEERNRKTQEGKDISAALKRAGESDELDVAISNYNQAKSNLDAARIKRNNPIAGVQWEAKLLSSQVGDAQKKLSDAGKKLIAVAGKVKQSKPAKQDAVQEPSPDISIAEPISSSETPEPGDEVGWTTGRGDKATSVVGQIRFGNAQVEWFGIKYVPLGELTLIRKSARRINREKREAGRAAAITSPEPETPSKEFVFSKKEIAALNNLKTPEEWKIKDDGKMNMSLIDTQGREWNLTMSRPENRITLTRGADSYVFVKTNTSSISGLEQEAAGQEGEVKTELTPEQSDVVVFVDIENDTQEKAVVTAEKKKRITPGEARKKGIAIQIDRLGITSKDPASVIAALERIAAKPSEKHHGRIAKDLLSVLEGSGVQIEIVSGNNARMAKHDSRVNGWYDPATNTAYINLDGPHELGIEETILHELVHASGEKVIQNPQTDAQKRILADLEKQMLAARKNAIALGQAMMGVDVSDLKMLIDMAAAQNDYGLFDILYGVSSLSEYHAHATTSRSFQKFLATYKEGGKRSLMERFINSITSLLSGKKTAEGSDAEKAYATLLDLMRENKGDVRLSNADVVQSRARGRFDLVDAVRAASSGDASTPFQALNEAINANTELTRRIQAESERRSRAYARGKGAILEQIIRAGNTGRLPEEAIKPITDFVNSVSPQALADTRISLSAKPQNSTFDFVDSLVTLALNGMGSEPGEIDRTAIHEFWHGLSRFIPDDEIDKIREDYVAAVKEYISENPWFVPFIGRTHLSEAQYDDLSRVLSKEEMDAIPWKNWETLEDGRRIRGLKWTKENYRLFRLDEWVAETMADLVRRKQERPTTFLGKIARLFRDFIDTLKQALGNPYLKALDAMTVPEEAFDAQIERFGPIEDNPPVMYGGEGVGMNNQFAESRARGIVSDTVTKFAPEFNVVDDKDGPSVFFDGRNVTVNPDALENLDEYEVKDLSERAVISAKAAPKDPIAASIIQQTDGYNAYNFDSVTRKEIRKSLAKAHAVATENGMAPLAMDLGAKLFEYGGATDAEARKSMARGIPSDEEYLAAVEAGDIEKAQKMVDEAAKATGYNVGPVWHGTPNNWTVFDLKKAGSTDNGYLGKGIYLGPSKRWGEVYSRGRNVLTLFASIKNPLVVQAEFNGRREIDRSITVRNSLGLPGDSSSNEVTKEAVKQGYDGIQYSYKGEVESVVFSSEQIKSADPVTRDDDGNIIPLSQRFQSDSPDIRYSRARGTEGVAYVPTKRSAPRLAVAKFFAGFRSRGMVTEDTYEIFNNSNAYKREIASFISFIGKDFSNVANKHFGEGEENWLSYRIFSRDSTGEVTVSKTGFKTAKEAESFAQLNRIKDYTVATGEDLMNRALGSNGPTLSENVREKIEQLTKKGLDDIHKSIAAYKEEYLDYWNLVMLETQADMVDAKQIATLRERKQQWMKALQLRAAEQKQIVDDARKEAVRVALEEGTNRIIAQQQFAKSYLPDDLVHQIERSRAKIDELSGRLTKIEWLMDGSQLQMIIDAKTGVYVTRSYEAFETNDRVGYVNWLDEAYRALYDPKQDYDPLAKERIMPLVRHLKNNIIERRIEDLKLENEQRQVDEIMADLMTDPRQVTQVEMVPGQSTEGTEYEELVRAVAKRELLRRRSEEKRDFIRRAMRSLALNGFASNIGNVRKRATALRKEANRLYDQRYPEQVAVAGIMGAPNALRYTLMTDDEAHDIANAERAISENPGSVNGSEIWTASISGEKHSSFYAAVNDDFRQNLDFITGAPSSKTGFSGATANDWKRLGDKILEHKNDVPAFLRTFLGERDNPLLRVSDTLLKQSHLIAVGELYQNLAKTGMAQGWIVDRGTLSLDGKKYAGWKTILDSEKTNQGYENNPFSGKYIDPVMADAINVMLAANQPSNSAFKAVAKFVGFALWGVTAGSVKAIIRNLLSAPSFLLNSGFLATILDPRRLRSTAQNVALASIVMQESMSSVAKVSGGKKIDNTVLKGLDWVWTGLLTIAASQRTATGVMKGVGTVGEFISQMKSKPTSEAAQQFYSLAVRLGVANDNVQKEAMERLLSLEETISRQPRDKNLGRFAKALKLDGVVGFGSYLLGTIKSAGQQRSQLYGAPDDFTKILAWLNEMDSQARIHAKDTAQYNEWKGADGLFTNMPENLVKLAADHTTDTIQSHSKVWAHITQFKKAGFGVLLAPFVAARAEFYRNAINAYRIGFQELRSENGKERSYGAMRIASAFLAHTVYAKAAGIALSMIFKAMADDDDVAEDSPEKREAIRKLGPEYAKNKNATYVVYKNGTFDWLDISFSDPFSFVSSSLNAARRGIDEKAVDDHVAWSVAKELMAENFGTFVSPQIAVGATATMISGYDPVRGIKIWDSQADTTAEKVQKAIAYYAKQAGTPGDVKSAMNIIKAARGIEENGRQYKLGTEVGGVFLGASVRTIKVTDMVEQKLAQAKDNLNTRISALYDAQLNDSNIHTDEDFVGPAETYHRVGQDAIRRMQKVWKAGETLLADTPGGKKMLNAVMESDKVKMSEVIERAIKTGKNVPSTLSPQTKQKIGDLGKKHGDDRLPITEDTLKRLNQKP